MPKIFLIVGIELNQNIVNFLEVNHFEFVGYEYTLDAALVTLRGGKIKAEIFIVNGLAQASGISEGEINRNQSLLLKLRELRMSEPKGRILLLLPGQNSSELILNIISLGIYDIHQISKFSAGDLLKWINNPMTIADYKDFRPAKVKDFPLGEIKLDSDFMENNFKKSPDNLIRKTKSKNLDDLVNTEAGKNKKEIRRQRKKLLALILAGNPKVEVWIKRSFSEQLDLLMVNEFDDIRSIILDNRPDIFIVLGCNNTQNDFIAEEIAIWAVDKVGNLIFIIGQLDETGRATKDRIASAGINYIISCEQGGYISGDELIYLINKIIKENDNFLVPTDILHSYKSKQSNLLNKFMKIKRNLYEKGNNGHYLSSKSEGIVLEEIPKNNKIIRSEQVSSISPGAVLAIVSPWRPNLAGRIAAQAVRLFSESEGETVAYIGASKDSTGAIWLDISDEVLMISDWRVPGSKYPIEQGNIKIFPVDPSKNLAIKNEENFWQNVRNFTKKQSYTVIDFAGDIMLVEKILKEKRLVVLVILPGADPVEYKTSLYWYNNMMRDKENIVAGIDLRGSVEKITDSNINIKIVIRNSPADALLSSLKAKGNDNKTFVWS